MKHHGGGFTLNHFGRVAMWTVGMILIVTLAGRQVGMIRSLVKGA